MDEATYRQYILNVFQNMTHLREMKDAQYVIDGYNDSCGDAMRLYVKVDDDDTITDASFTGDGCLLSQAGAELTCEAIIGKGLEEAKTMDSERLLSLLGFQPTASRLKCVELPVATVKKITKN